ncbi:TIGR03619 family F420-dependent LLM class oxidoreductase [Kribbella sp. NPDC000426]|uniref:TIGR03619 family F420-dependent LLM class oxidoreductase n=1 Tax=Kribbella sp. NPDC000426 TaxID=3154255 RepID=UPI00331B8963
MKFAVAYSTPGQGMDPDRLVEFAQHAEACGFEGLYVPEHVALYRGASLGGFELPTTLEYADPLDLLTYVAAATDHLLLGTAVLLLPYHHPVTLAKRLATIDVLSKGRMRLLTVGLGSLAGEAHAVGVDYATRGRRADEAIDVLRLLWSGGPDGVSHSGEFYNFENLTSYPHPLASLPIHIGGSSRAAARRAALRGNGYFPGGNLPPTERAAQWDLARKTSPRDNLEYTRWASTDLTPVAVHSYARQGVTRLVINPQSLEDLTTFAHRFSLS